MGSPNFDPARHSRYSREVFRATATSYQKRLVAERPDVAIDSMIGAMHDLGAFFGCFKDAYDKDKGNMLFVNTDGEMAKKAVLERCELQKIAADKAHRLRLVEKELVLQRVNTATQVRLGKEMRDELKKMGDKVTHQEQVLEEQSRVCAERSETIETLKSELARRTKELEDEKARTVVEVRRATSEAVQRFLVSNAFTQAAPLACLGAMKTTVYHQLGKMGEYFPFTPEQAGFDAVPSEDSGIRKLEGYTWNIGEDKLMNPNGTPFDGQFIIATGHHGPFPHAWKGKHPWPEHLDLIDPPSGDPSDIMAEEEQYAMADSGEENPQDDVEGGSINTLDAGSPGAP